MKDKASRDNVLAIIGIIFFVFLAISARSGFSQERDSMNTSSPNASLEPSSSPEQDDATSQEEKNSELFSDTNYHFTITVSQDDQIEIIDGERDGNKQKFSIIGSSKEEYAKISENYLKLENGHYTILNTAVRSYFPYLELDSLKDILNESFVTENDEVFTYVIEVCDLLDFYTDVEYNGFDEFADDSVKVYQNKKGQVYKIELDYSHYFSYFTMQETSQNSIFQVTMEFDQFGKIQDLDI